MQHVQHQPTPGPLPGAAGGPVTEGDMAQWEAGQQATPAVQPPQPAEQPAPLYLHVEQQPRQPPAPQQPASQPLSEQRPPKPPLSPHLHPGLPQQAQPWGLAGGAMHAAPGVLPEAEAAVPPPLAVLPGELIRLGTLGDLSMALGSLDFEELGASLAALGDLSVSQLSVVMGPLEPPPRAAGGAGPGTAAEGAAGRQQLPQQPGSFGFLDPARLEDLSIVLSSLDRSPQGFGGEEEEAGLPGPEQQQQQLWEQLDSGAGEQPPQYDLPPAAAPPPGHLHAAALSLASLRDLSMALGSLDLRDLPPELRSLRLSDLSMMLGSLDLGALPRDDRSLRLAELSKELGTLREEVRRHGRVRGARVVPRGRRAYEMGRARACACGGRQVFWSIQCGARPSVLPCSRMCNAAERRCLHHCCYDCPVGCG